MLAGWMRGLLAPHRGCCLIALTAAVKRQSALAAGCCLRLMMQSLRSGLENDKFIIKQPKARWCGAPLHVLKWNVQYKIQKINGLCHRATEIGDKKAASAAASFWCVP
jgi:hypothetical protein